MEPEEKGVKPEEITPPTTPPVVEEPPKETPPAEGVKTEKEPEGVKAEPEEVPWGKDPRFTKFLEDKKGLEERAGTLKGLENDPDFATFLAFKRNKEAMSEAEKKPDYANMTAEEYADHVAANAEKRADERFRGLVEANKEGDKMAADAVSFASERGIDKEVFKKEWAPKIVGYYENVAKELPETAMDAFVKAHPPKDVFKALYFDKAGEAGVTKYKQDIEKAKGGGFEAEGAAAREGAPEGFESSFEQNWKKMFGGASELPQSALEKK